MVSDFNVDVWLTSTLTVVNIVVFTRSPSVVVIFTVDISSLVAVVVVSLTSALDVVTSVELTSSLVVDSIVELTSLLVVDSIVELTSSLVVDSIVELTSPFVVVSTDVELTSVDVDVVFSVVPPAVVWPELVVVSVVSVLTPDVGEGVGLAVTVEEETSDVELVVVSTSSES